MDATEATATTSTGQRPEAAGQKSGTISSDFETFLKMLTVQMENQDPLNPVDSSEYAVQLATFSGVEQQVRTNDLLEGLATSMGAGGLMSVAGWVGRAARVSAPVAYLGQPVPVVADVAEGADAAHVIARLPDGTEMDRQQFDPTAGEIAWTPASGDALLGVPLTFEIESFRSGESIDSRPAEAYAPVREVRMTDGEPSIVLPGGATLPAGMVTALRDG